ncbi:hypothetical protein [Acetivibrio ethanolgignens]|nr:hypothetical protein [Acetivibrio ethanolgignens]
MRCLIFAPLFYYLQVKKRIAGVICYPLAIGTLTGDETGGVGADLFD